MPPTPSNQPAMDTTRCMETAETDVLAVFIAAGADPQRLAQWMHQNTDTPTPIDTLTRLGEALRRATQDGVRKTVPHL